MMADRLELERMESYNLTKDASHFVQIMALIGKPGPESDTQLNYSCQGSVFEENKAGTDIDGVAPLLLVRELLR